MIDCLCRLPPLLACDGRDRVDPFGLEGLLVERWYLVVNLIIFESRWLLKSGQSIWNLVDTSWSVCDGVVVLHEPESPPHEAPRWIVERQHPAECIVVGAHSEVRTLEVWAERENPPHDCIALAFGRRVIPLLLRQCLGVIANGRPLRRLLRVLLLEEDHPQRILACVTIQHERAAWLGKSKDRR